MNEKLSDALNEVRDAFIAEAANSKKKHILPLVSAIAAVLAIALTVGLLPRLNRGLHMCVSSTEPTGSISIFTDPTGSISIVTEPTKSVTEPPAVTQPPATGVLPTIPIEVGEVICRADYSLAQSAYAGQLSAGLREFWEKSMETTLGKDPGANKAYSPANLYMALCLLAELTDGEEQLMNLLGAKDLAALRESANTLWNAAYTENNDKIALANSVWLQETLNYNEEIMQLLAQNYFTSSFRGDLGSDTVNARIASWLNEQTDGLLQEQTENIQLKPETVFALYSTLYYKVRWATQFNEEKNTKGVFYDTDKSTVTFMNQSLEGNFYSGSKFTAICVKMRTGNMWFVLPNEGVTPEEAVSSGEYLDLVLGKGGSAEWCKIDLSLPKFDIQTGGSLKEDLENLGVTNIFNTETTAFDGFLDAFFPVYVSEVNQQTRVCVDEMGVTAANYVDIAAPGSPPPPTKTVDFTLNRPFLYVITTNDNLPLFAGIVNEL